MEWDVAIRRNREALLRVVAILFVMAGLREDALSPSSRSNRPPLPRFFIRPVRNSILRMLRPAESALRRLIIIAARGLTVSLPPAGKPKPSPMRKTGAPMTVTHQINLGLAGVPSGPRQRRAPDSGLPLTTSNGEELNRGTDNPFPDRIPAFQLFDPFKRFTRKRYAKTMPRVRSLDPDRSLPVYMRSPERPAKPVPSPDDDLPARAICLRLLAARAALDDLDAEAKRLARWQARRDRAHETGERFRPYRTSTLRPGYPPGRRKRHRYDVDAVLKECHALVHYSDRHPP
jgi:hypothetical protein